MPIRSDELEPIGYLCIQNYPNRICKGCTSACAEQVFAYPETPKRSARFVVWDLTQRDSTGPDFGPMTFEDSLFWRDKPNFFVQELK